MAVLLKSRMHGQCTGSARCVADRVHLKRLSRASSHAGNLTQMSTQFRSRITIVCGLQSDSRLVLRVCPLFMPKPITCAAATIDMPLEVLPASGRSITDIDDPKQIFPKEVQHGG